MIEILIYIEIKSELIVLCVYSAICPLDTRQPILAAQVVTAHGQNT